MVEVSDSEESDAVDGSYSCFSGDEDRLRAAPMALAVRTGTLDAFNSRGLDERWLGVDGAPVPASLELDRGLPLAPRVDEGESFDVGGESHSGSSSGSSIGVVGGLSLRIFGMIGRSIDGVEATER